MSFKARQPRAELLALSSWLRRPARFQCLRKVQQLQPPLRRFSKAPQKSQHSIAEQSRPRWSHTPEAMTAPVTLRNRNTSNNFQVNESQEKLDAFYNRFLGEGGDKLLTEEVKWLAVTHKSFDQGRRGYNDRLAFLGLELPDIWSARSLTVLQESA